MEQLRSATEEFIVQAQRRPLAVVFAALVAVSFATRLLTAQGRGREKAGARGIPAVPYWVPVLGHVPNLALGSGRFFTRLRDAYADGIFSLKILGGRHIFIANPDLGTTVLNKPASVADGHAASKYLMQTNFGWPAKTRDDYDAILPAIRDEYKALTSEPYLSTMVDRTVRELRHNIADYITFNDHFIDQSPWERAADALPTTDRGGEPVMEASLWALTRDFVSLTANPSLFGSDFVTNFPDIWDDLWAFDAGFMALAMNLPGWVPWPALRRARAARSRMLARLREFETALDQHGAGTYPGARWSDVADVGPLLQGRLVVYRKLGISIESRAAIELGLLWAMNANANPLVPWILVHVYSDADLLARMRAEVAPFVKTATTVVDGMTVPATFESLDVDGLADRCPLLKAAYIECLRLEFHAWSFKAVRQDILVGEKDKLAGPYLIPEGTYAHVAHELHHMNPRRFPDPDKWSVERHIKWETRPGSDEKVAVADMGPIRPYGMF